MGGTIWVCTGQQGVWIPAPESPMENPSGGNSVETPLLDGGMYVKKSAGSAKSYTCLWKGKSADLQPIKDLYDGIYGKGPFYFIDPASVKNVLPAHWAKPSLCFEGWPTIAPGRGYPNAGVTKAATSSSSIYTPPPYMGVFEIPGSGASVFSYLTTPYITIPIPPTDTMQFKAWGSVTGTAAIQVRAFNRTTGAMSTFGITPTITGAGNNWSGATYSHLEVWLNKSSGATSTISLSGMVATTLAAPSVITSGLGHSGVQFSGDLGKSTYMATDPGWEYRNGLWREIGSWLH